MRSPERYLDKRSPAVAGNTTVFASEPAEDNVHSATSETSWTAIRHINGVLTPQSFILQTNAIAPEPESTKSQFVMETPKTEGTANLRTDILQHESHYSSLCGFDTVEEQGNVITSRPPPLATSPSMQYACWQHGCNGRTFTTLSNYRRHCKERSFRYARPQCPRCGQQFSREAARDTHYNQQRCRMASIDANGNILWTLMGAEDTSENY
jgi:hypothetical protein